MRGQQKKKICQRHVRESREPDGLQGILENNILQRRNPNKKIYKRKTKMTYITEDKVLLTF